MTFPLCANLFVTHCLLFHSRSTKEILISHSGYYCLRKYGFVYFPFSHTRSLLGLHQCVATSTGLQVMKALVSRQSNISNEWAIIGKKMPVWLHQVCFLVFLLCKESPLESALHLPGHCHVGWSVQYCHLSICSSIHSTYKIGAVVLKRRVRHWLHPKSTFVLGRQIYSQLTETQQ